jgi:hypothetical protein
VSRLRLRIDGEPGEIGFPDFVEILRHAFHALRDLDSSVSRGKPTLKWFVDELRTGSLVTDVRASGNVAEEVTNAFVRGVQHLESEATVPPFFTMEPLEDIQWIARHIGNDGARGFRAIQLDSGESAHVTPVTDAHITEALAARFESVGSVMGTIEMISIHGRARANVYDLRNNRAIRCNIPEAERDRLVAEVTANLGKRVIAAGRIYRNASGEPIRVTLRSITVLPEAENLPGVADVVGSAPGYTGDLTTEEYMRRLRDA